VKTNRDLIRLSSLFFAPIQSPGGTSPVICPEHVEGFTLNMPKGRFHEPGGQAAGKSDVFFFVRNVL